MKASPRAKALLGVIAFAASARLTDVALVGAGFATAAGSVVFAGAMLMRGNQAPSVNGLEYLAIFARPRGAPKPADEPAARPFDAAGVEIDPTPVGSIGAAPPAGASGYAIVAAKFGFAWVRDGARIFAVRPGDMAPGLGRVTAIVLREGRWTLVGEGGAVLLAGGAPAPTTDSGAPFARQMIFGSGQ